MCTLSAWGLSDLSLLNCHTNHRFQGSDQWLTAVVRTTQPVCLLARHASATHCRGGCLSEGATQVLQ